MLRTTVLEQLPGLCIMDIKAKLQTADVVSRIEIQHRLITLCWGCHQIVCHACCASQCMTCPLLAGRNTAFLQRSWALQLAEKPAAEKRIMNGKLAPKCPTCHRLMCILCDLGICPGCLSPPKKDQPTTSEHPNDCPSCSRRICSGCGRCECRRCQPELCRLCMRVLPHPCSVQCPGFALTEADLPLPPPPIMPSSTEDKLAGKNKKKEKAANLPVYIRCPACDRSCRLDLIAGVFCCRGRWEPVSDCSHGRLGRTQADASRKRLELAGCSSGESCESEESTEPIGFAELIPAHCRIFKEECGGAFGDPN